MTTSPDPLGWSEPQAASAEIGRLYEAHGRMVVGLCRFLLRDPVEAEDAAQQTFVAAHRSLLRGSIPRDAAAWLATIARNECRARIRLRMREPLSLGRPDDAAGQVPDPFHTAVENADLQALRAGLEELPESQRSAFVLREFAGLSYNELARALEVTEPAVESLLVRARTRLRMVLSHANPLVVPVVLRDQFSRLTTYWDDGSVGGVAKIASLPFAAKLAAAGTGAVLAVAGGAGVGRVGDGHPAGVARLETPQTTVIVRTHRAAAPTTVVRTTRLRPAESVVPVRRSRRTRHGGDLARRGGGSGGPGPSTAASGGSGDRDRSSPTSGESTPSGDVDRSGPGVTSASGVSSGGSEGPGSGVELVSPGSGTDDSVSSGSGGETSGPGGSLGTGDSGSVIVSDGGGSSGGPGMSSADGGSESGSGSEGSHSGGSDSSGSDGSSPGG